MPSPIAKPEPQLAHRKLNKVVRSYPYARQVQLVRLLLEENRYFYGVKFCKYCQKMTRHDKVKELDEVVGLFWDDLQCQECKAWKTSNCRILWIDEQDDKRNQFVKEVAQ